MNITTNTAAIITGQTFEADVFGSFDESHDELQLHTQDPAAPSSYESTALISMSQPGEETIESAVASVGGDIKPENKLGADMLASARKSAKLYVMIVGFDEQSEKQREQVRKLIAAQSEALENKLKGIAPSQGEDFDSIAKLLRKENNKLDSLLVRKESLLKKSRIAATEAVALLQDMIGQIDKLEDES